MAIYIPYEDIEIYGALTRMKIALEQNDKRRFDSGYVVAKSLIERGKVPKKSLTRHLFNVISNQGSFYFTPHFNGNMPFQDIMIEDLSRFDELKEGARQFAIRTYSQIIPELLPYQPRKG